MDKDKIIPTLAELLEMNYEDIDEKGVYIWRHRSEDPHKLSGYTPGHELKLMKEFNDQYKKILENYLIWGDKNNKDNE